MSNVPKLRFNDFTETWNIETLGSYLIPFSEKIPASSTDIPVYSSSRTGLKPQSEYFDNRELANEGEYGVVPKGYFTYRHMSDDLTFKFNINDVHDRIAVSKEYPVFTTNTELNSRFLLEALNFGSAFKRYAIAQKAGGTRTRLYFKKLCDLKLRIPSVEEQQKIAAFLTAVDTKIEQLTKKEQLLQRYKKGVMQKIFSQEIRFKADDGSEFPEWTVKSLSKISKRKTAKNTDESIKQVLTNSATKGIVSQTDYFDKDIANQDNLGGYYIVDTDDFVYNPRISVSAPVGPIKRNHLSIGVMSPLYTVFELACGEKGFFERYFETTLWHRYMNRIANFGARHDRMNVTTSDFYEMPMPYPSLTEQQKITDFLSGLDMKLQQATDQLDAAKTFKKGLLQQMFV